MLFNLMPASISNNQHKYKFRFSTLATALAVTSTSQIALAQQETSDIIHVSQSPFNHEKIAVAQQVDVIDAQAPELQSATSVLDLLKGQSGILVTGAGSTYGQSLQMRGYDSRGVKITVDNVTQDFSSGLFDATFIDPTLVKKVTVHKGGGSLHHGGGALAGLVSIKTLNATDLLKPGQKLGGQIYSGINRNDHSYYAGSALYGRTGNLDALLSYSKRKKQLDDVFASKSLNHDENIDNWMVKTTWFARPEYQVALQLKEYRNESITLKQPAVQVDMTRYKNTPHERKSHQRDVIINQHFNLNNQYNWQADWDAYYSVLTLDQLDLVKVNSIFNKINKYDQEKRYQYSYGTTFSNSFNLPVNGIGNQYIQSGFDYIKQQQKSNDHATSYPPSELANASFWLIDDFTLAYYPVTFSAGTRFTHYQTSRKEFATNTQTNWSSRFAISATPVHWLTLRTSYSEGYRTPKMAELYNNSHHFSIPFTKMVSNFRVSPDLQPETNKTYEAGLDFSFDEIAFTGDSLQFGSTFFSTKAQNHITVDSTYSALENSDKTIRGYFPDETFFINVPFATIYGFDSFIQYKTYWFDLNASYNQTIGKEDKDNYTLSAIRPESLIVRFNAPILTTGLNLGWVGEFSAKTKFEGNTTYLLPKHKSKKGLDRYHKEVVQYAGYGVHDFYINYKADQFIEGLSSTLALKNAFDKNYVSSMGIPQEGRNFYFNVNYKW